MVAEVSANTRSIGAGRCGDSSGIRTSNPAAASRGPVIAISSHASSWLRITWPRRVPPGRRSAGNIRSRRVISSSRSRRLEPALTIACSIGTKAPFSPEANTARFQASPRSGGSSRTISAACSRVTDRAQSSARSTSSPGDTQRSVERAPVESREKRFGDVGGGADARWRRRHLDPAGTVPADRVDHAGQRGASRGPARRRSDRLPERCPASRRRDRCRRAASTKAGIQRTEKDALELLAVPRRRRRWRSNGTIAPRAVSSTAQTATRPNHRTLGATSSTCPAPAATSHPSTSPTGTANAAARRAPRQRDRGVADPPRRRRACSAEHGHDLIAVGGRRDPVPAPRHHAVPVPTTPAPGALRARLGSSRARAAPDTVGRRARSPPLPSAVNRAHAADNRRRSDCASASTWSRSSPRSARALATNSSASRTRRSSVSRHPARSASSTASCSAVASPSASASTQRSNCHGATAAGAEDCVTGSSLARRRWPPTVRNALCGSEHHLRPTGDSRRTPLCPRRRTSDSATSGGCRRTLSASDPDHRLAVRDGRSHQANPPSSTRRTHRYGERREGPLRRCSVGSRPRPGRRYPCDRLTTSRERPFGRTTSRLSGSRPRGSRGSIETGRCPPEHSTGAAGQPPSTP